MNPKSIKNLTDYRNFAFHHTHLRKPTRPTWKGISFTKYGTDMALYAEIIYENKPDFIIEAGTSFGGSALFFADMLNTLCGGGKVISIDVRNRIGRKPHHPNLEFIRGSSIDPEIVQDVMVKVFGGSVMVSLDSKHTFNHVRDELLTYKDIVTPGQFIVVEDCYVRHERISGPGIAVNWFLEHDKSFRRENPEEKYLISVTREGWLRRIH